MFNRIDEWMITRGQAAYLWLYDWTGVYVATIAAIVMVLSNCSGAIFRLRPVGTIDLLLCGINLIVLLPYYKDQDRARYTAYNARAMFFQDNLFRRIISQFFFITLFLEPLRFIWDPETWSILQLMFSECCILMYFVLMCVCIREREPKEWFKRLELSSQSI